MIILEKMKIGILTFCFAHNYGAVLQAAALKSYVESLDDGNYVTMINYVPKRISHIYSLNPLVQSKSVRSVVKHFLQIPNRFGQYFLFEHFIQELTDCKPKIVESDCLAQELKKYDALICGSDQIWNMEITGDVTDYFFDSNDADAMRIAYAASFGSNKLTQFQKKTIEKFLPHFKGVSLREEDGMADVCSVVNGNVPIVVDPVFLQDQDYWEKESERSKFRTSKSFLLYYSLKNNLQLIKKAETMAKNMGIEIFIIHPTGVRPKIKGKFLKGIGPREFLWLIRNAKCVCTDSFHATAFSLIFKKKYLHVKNNEKESRVESILRRLNCYDSCCMKLGEIDILDFQKLDSFLLKEHIFISKNYISSVLNEKIMQ